MFIKFYYYDDDIRNACCEPIRPGLFNNRKKKKMWETILKDTKSLSIAIETVKQFLTTSWLAGIDLNFVEVLEISYSKFLKYSANL